MPAAVRQRELVALEVQRDDPRLGLVRDDPLRMRSRASRPKVSLPPLPVAARLGHIERAVQPVDRSDDRASSSSPRGRSCRGSRPRAGCAGWRCSCSRLLALALRPGGARPRGRRSPPSPAAVHSRARRALVGWSAAPRETLGRAAAFALVLLARGGARAGRERAAGALPSACWTRSSRRAALVALGGLLCSLFAYDRAVQPATTVAPGALPGARRRAEHGDDGARGRRSRSLRTCASTRLDAASRARVAVRLRCSLGIDRRVRIARRAAAAFAGLATCGAVRRPRRPAGARARWLRSRAGAALSSPRRACCPIPLPPAAPSEVVARPPHPRTPSSATGDYVDANCVLRLQDDVGHPGSGVGDDATTGRTLTGSSGRTEAWAGALGLGARSGRCSATGSGPRTKVFVDRYINFNSAVPENSYVGLLLQLGAAGCCSSSALPRRCSCRAVRVRTCDARVRGLRAACAGALVGGLVLGAFQSYLYAAGNNATAALWICGVPPRALRRARRPMPPPSRLTRARARASSSSTSTTGPASRRPRSCSPSSARRSPRSST